MKKKLTGTAALVAVGVGLAGCAAGGVPGGGSGVALDPDATLDGEITVWSWDVAPSRSSVWPPTSRRLTMAPP